MRKIKEKKKEEVVENIEKKEEVKDFELRNILSRKVDWIIYALFFILSLMQKEIFLLVKIMALITVLSIIYTAVFKKWNRAFVYKMMIFFLLCLISWPFNLMIKKYIGG